VLAVGCFPDEALVEIADFSTGFDLGKTNYYKTGRETANDVGLQKCLLG
jgi:hypothetical protein